MARELGLSPFTGRALDILHGTISTCRLIVNTMARRACCGVLVRTLRRGGSRAVHGLHGARFVCGDYHVAVTTPALVDHFPAGGLCSPSLCCAPCTVTLLMGRPECVGLAGRRSQKYHCAVTSPALVDHVSSGGLCAFALLPALSFFSLGRTECVFGQTL